jgi:segregation and condensation protein A
MLDTSIQVKTEQFDGPLALLLLLIQKEEMNIRELNLKTITGQYLNFLAQMKEMNFDLAGEYLYLAATLLLLKSKSCVTEEDISSLKAEFGIKEDFAISSEEDLIRRLEELHKFQKLSLKLWDLDKLGYDIFVKPRVNKKIIIDSILTPISLTELTGAMLDFLRRDKRKYAVVKRDRLSIKEKLQFMKHFLKMNQKYELTELIKMDGDMSIDNIVITFISVLELARMRRLAIFQNENYASIYIEVVKSLEDFDVNLANGFEPEDGTGGDLLDANEENTELEPGAQPVLLH